jgi:hypothetical protein
LGPGVSHNEWPLKRQTPGQLKTQVRAVGLLRALLTGNGGVHSTEGGSM